MKVFIITTAISVLVAVAAFPQSEETGFSELGVRVGIGSGVLSTSIDDLKENGESARLGGIIGVFAVYKVTPIFSLQSELLYIGKGAGGDLLGGETWTHQYLELPVLAKYDLSNGTALIPAFYAGIAPSYLVSASYNHGIWFDDEYDIDIEEVVSDFDFGIVFGTSVDYKHFTLDVRYTLGLVDVYDYQDWNLLTGATDESDYGHMGPNDTVKNRFLGISLEFRFY